MPKDVFNENMNLNTRMSLNRLLRDQMFDCNHDRNIFFQGAGITSMIGQASNIMLGVTGYPAFGVISGISTGATWGLRGAGALYEFNSRYGIHGPSYPPDLFRSPLRGPYLRDINSFSQSTLIRETENALRWNSNFGSAYLQICSNLGYPTSFSYYNFQSLVRATGLVSSYNNIHSSDRIPPLASYRGEIGGVATKIGIFPELKNSLDQVLYNETILALPIADNSLPFQSSELKQILRELANGIFLHNTYPFFSLHFNNDGNLYPVIHPSYQNTLVGKVIGFLDYFMKCYLNGSFFDERFLETWHETMNRSHDFLKLHLIDLKKYSREFKSIYRSLHEEMFNLGLEAEEGEALTEENKFAVRHNNFCQTSFRIIAKQNSPQKYQNIMVMNPNVDVEYTPTPSPEYKAYLDKYLNEKGEYPADYQLLLVVYKEFSNKIKDHFLKLPFVKSYTQMLNVISFLCYYLTTLKDIGKMPHLPLEQAVHHFEFPKALPPIPRREFKKLELVIPAGKVYQKIASVDKAGLDNWFKNYSIGVITHFPFENLLNVFLLHFIIEHLPANAIKDPEEFTKKAESLASGFIAFNTKIVDNYLKEFNEKFDGMHKALEKTLNSRFYINPTQNLVSKLETLKHKVELECEKNKSSFQKVRENFTEDYKLLKKYLESSSEYLIKDESTLTYSISYATYGFQNVINGHRFVGGCGVTFSNLSFSQVPSPEKFSASVSDTIKHLPNETLSMTSILGQRYALFRLPLAPNLLAHAKPDYQSLAHASVKQPINKLSENELKLLLGAMDKTSENSAPTKSNLQAKDQGGQTIVHHAASLGNVDLSKLVKNDITSLSIRDNQGFLPIHTAAVQGNASFITQAAALHPAGINAIALDGACAITLAAQQGHIEAVKALVKHGANVNYRLPNGLFALYLAIQNNHTDIALYLINISNVNFALDTGTTPLLLAIDAEQIETAKALINAKADLTSKRKLTGENPLHVAAKTGQAELCRLLQPRMNPNLQLSNGNTALHLAADEDHSETVVALLETKLGMNANIQNQSGNTALMSAIVNANTDTAMKLIDHSNIHLKNQENKTSLLLAGETGQFEIGDQLLEKGADPEHKDNDGLSYTFHLIQSGEYLRYKELVQTHKLDINQKYFGKTPLDWAALRGHKLLFNYLKNQSAQFTLHKQTGWELIHYAAKMDAFDYLMSQKKYEDISTGIDRQKSLVYIAAENGSVESLKFLSKQLTPALIQRAYFNEHLLYAAIKSGNLDIIQMVLRFCDINDPIDDEKNTAMHICVKFGMKHLLSPLKDLGADLTKSNQQRLTPFHQALQNDDPEFLEELIKETPAEQRPNLSSAISKLNIKCHPIIKKYSTDFIPKSEEPYSKEITPDLSMKLNIAMCKADTIEDYDLLYNTYTDYSDQQGFSILHVAVQQNKIPFIEYALEKGFDINKRDRHGHTPLMLAALLAKAKIMRLLLLKGADANLKSLRQDTALHCAIAGKSTQCALQLLAITDKIDIPDRLGFTPLLLAVTQKMTSVVKRLIIKGADVNHLNTQGFGIMHLAVMFEQEQIIRYLINMAYPLDSTNWNLSPLHLAFEKGNIKIATDLIKAGADVKRTTSNNKSVIDFAMLSKDFSTARFVLSLPEFQDNASLCKAFHSAAAANNISVLRELLLANCSINMTNDTGMNALHIAALNDSVQAAGLLIDQGIELEMVTNEGNAPLHLASFSGSVTIMQQLCEQKVALNKQNTDGMTPLHLACTNKHTPAVMQLLKAGADPHLVNKNNKTAAQIALLNDDWETARLIVSMGDRTSLAKNRLSTFSAFERNKLSKWDSKLLELEKEAPGNKCFS